MVMFFIIVTMILTEAAIVSYVRPKALQIVRPDLSISVSSKLEVVGDIRWDAARESCAPFVEGSITVLVTGSAGFVGFHVCKLLKAQGAGALGLDNLNDYYHVVLKRVRVAELEKIEVYTLEADRNDARVIRKALDRCSFTHVLHLAVQAGVRYAVKNPSSYIHSNIAGTVILFEAIVRTNPMPKVVFASSSLWAQHQDTFF